MLVRSFRLLALLVFAFISSMLFAQGDASPQVKPFAPIHGGDFDSVTLTNGALNVKIPVISYPQRGGDLKIAWVLRYSLGNGWQTKPSRIQGVNGTWVWKGAGVSLLPDFGGSLQQTTWTDSNGITYVTSSFADGTGGAHRLGTTSPGIYESIDGSGIRCDGTACTTPDGIKYLVNGVSITSPGPVIIDRNGNAIYFTSSGTFVDTMNRTVFGFNIVPNSTPCPSGSTSGTEYDFPGINGGTYPVVVCSATFGATTAFGLVGFSDGSTTATLTSAVVLPDGSSYRFNYDSYFNLSSITLPAGGTISYTWTNTTTTPGACGASSGIGRIVTSRTENANDGTGPHTWTYNWGAIVGGTTTSTETNVVTDPTGNDMVLTNTALAAPGGCGFYETQRQIYQGNRSSGSPLKTIATTYTPSGGDPYSYITKAPEGSGILPATVTTTLANGSVSQVVTTYDSTGDTFHDENSGPSVVPGTYPLVYGRVVSKAEYDFGAGTPGPLQRKTVNNYLWQSNSTYKTLNLLNTISSAVIQDGSGNRVAETDYGYDESSLQPSGVTTQFGTPADPVHRANHTSISKWLNTTGTFVRSTTNFFDTGMPTQVTDPLGHVTSYTYSSIFDGAYVTQANLPDTTYTDGTNTGTVHHVTTRNYDFNSGSLLSFTDENGQTTNYNYDNSLRLTSVSHPDGGLISYTYPDPFTITEQRRLDANGRTEISTTKYDGLGRVVQTQKSSGNGTVYVDTTYNALGEVASVSNPYYSTSDASYGVTQTQYDALGRVTATIKADSGIVTSQYSDSCTTVTDEAGYPRKACSDALGRLIEVDEPRANAVGTNATASLQIGGSLGSAQTSAPPTALSGSGLTGFVDSSGAQHWGYLNSSHHLYDLHWTSSAGYGFIDVTSVAAAPVAGANAVAGFSSSVAQWAYFDGNAHVINLYCCYGYADATAAAGAAPTSSGSGLGAFVDSGGGQHWAYLGANQHIYNLYWNAGVYAADDVTAATGGPAASGTSLAAFFSGAQQWAYLDTNEHVGNFYWSGGYGYGDATIGAGSPAAASGSSIAAFVDSRGGQHWAYLGTNQHLYNLYWTFSGGYGYGDVTLNAGAPVAAVGSAITAFGDSSGGQHWAYLGTNQHVYHLSWVAGVYSYVDVTVASGAPAAVAGSALTSFADSSTGQHWAFLGTNGHVYNIYLVGGSYGYHDINVSTNLVSDAGTVSLTVGSFTAIACFGSSTNSLCTGKPVNTTATQVAAALAQALNASNSPVTATSSGTTINLTWKTPGPFTPSVSALATTHDNPALFSSPSFTSPATSFSGGAGPSLANGYVTRYSYDTLNNLLQVNQQGDGTQTARVRTFTHDSLSRMLTATNPESGTISHSYDADGNVLQITEPAPNQTGAGLVTTSYAYDQLNRLTSKSYSDSTPAVAFVYDAASVSGIAVSNPIGRLVKQSTSAGSVGTINSYDSMGRTLSERQWNPLRPNGAQVNYAYDLGGGMTSIVYPDGRTINYTYDTGERALSAVDTANGINFATNANRTAFGALSSMTNGSAITVSNSYNKRLQPITLSASTASQTIMSFSYNFGLGNNDNGNVYGIVNNRDSVRSLTGSANYSYDSLKRLVAVTTTGTDCTSNQAGFPRNYGESFSYDAFGNLVSISASLCSAEHLSVSFTAANQITGFCYDAAGNLLNQGACGTPAYTYDGENRLTNAAGVSYLYDAEDRRVQKGSSKFYVYGLGGNVVAEGDGTGNFTTEYVFFSGKRIARIDLAGPSVHYYFSDHLGSHSTVTNATGSTIEQESDFYPFGGERILTAGSNNYKFTGKERDLETNFDDFGARYYVSALGRFLTPDSSEISPTSLANPQNLNMYAYGLDNPMRYVDPNGEAPLDSAIVVAISDFYTTTREMYSAYLSDFAKSGKLPDGKPGEMLKFASELSKDGHNLLAGIVMGGFQSAVENSYADALTGKVEAWINDPNTTVTDLQAGLLTMSGLEHEADVPAGLDKLVPGIGAADWAIKKAGLSGARNNMIYALQKKIKKAIKEKQKQKAKKPKAAKKRNNEPPRDLSGQIPEDANGVNWKEQMCEFRCMRTSPSGMHN